VLQKKFAKVSEIVVCINCPRQLYYALNNSNCEADRKTSTAYLTHLFLRELALRLPAILNNEHCLLDELKKALDRVGEEITLIYRSDLIDAKEEQVSLAKSAAEAQLHNIASGLQASIERYGKERLYHLLTPWKLEQEMTSQKYMLVGRLDKIIRIEGRIIPSIIKTSTPPDYGAWHPDRIQLTAYSILMEEDFDVAVERGLVEYARSGTLREIAIKRHDRRRVLQLRDEALKIKSGFLPERTHCTSECNYCLHKARCEPRVSLASKFF